MDTFDHILQKLPYDRPFLFVDSISSLSTEGVTGHYTFHKDHDFFQGHFKDNPVTPGVILVECMAQIGLVCLGLHLMTGENTSDQYGGIALAHANVDFFHPVFPGEKVTVESEKIYFRFGKLKCKVRMLDSKQRLVCKGEISGMSNTGTS